MKKKENGYLVKDHGITCSECSIPLQSIKTLSCPRLAATTASIIGYVSEFLICSPCLFIWTVPKTGELKKPALEGGLVVAFCLAAWPDAGNGLKDKFGERFPEVFSHLKEKKKD